MATLTQVSRQWASRPADERFTSLTDMLGMMERSRANSKARVVTSKSLSFAPEGDDHKGLVAIVDDTEVYAPTNHSFGQLATLAEAPAGYLRTLPSEIAADALNYGMKFKRQVQDIGVLTRENGVPLLRAATGPNYGRIWNADVLRSLVDHVGDGVTGDWRVPGEFGQRVPITKANTTLYASDRDMFVFLADEDNRIVMPNRRNGEKGSLARGFMVYNSEVGDKTFGIATVLFDYVCCNRIIWGAENFKEIKIRHTSGAPDRWLDEVKPALIAYAASSDATVVDTIKAAQARKVEDLDDFLNKRFGLGKNKIAAIKVVHDAEEGRPMESLWDVSTGITAYAKGVQYTDERVELERIGGQVLTLATK